MFDGNDVERDRYIEKEHLKCVFDTEALLNPGKVFPVQRRFFYTQLISSSTRVDALS